MNLWKERLRKIRIVFTNWLCSRCMMKVILNCIRIQGGEDWKSPGDFSTPCISPFSQASTKYLRK